MIRKSIFSMTVILYAAITTNAQLTDISLTQSVRSGIYNRGQRISVYAAGRSKTVDSLHVNIYKNNKILVKSDDFIFRNDSILVFDGRFDETCSVIVEAKYDGKSTSLGMLVEPEKLRPGSSCPDDFDDYWKAQKKLLEAMPLKIKAKKVNGQVVEDGYSCEDVELNCPGPKPARGYYAKPESAVPGSLPIVLLVHAAGVKGSWCRSEPQNAMTYARMGALCFDLNAHGMLDGQPDSYYEKLEKGELKDYWFQGLTSRDNIYFRGMYLRLLRTIDFLTRQPEWDGRKILVMGESQGGGQALVAAGLDHRVTAVVAIVPAMCDWFAPLIGRMGGWPHPFETGNSKAKMMQSLPYFDAANILKGSKATIFAEIGMIDMVCPSTSVYTALNQAGGRKIIYAVPYRPHHQPDKPYLNLWQDEVYKPRDLFIKNFFSTR